MLEPVEADEGLLAVQRGFVAAVRSSTTQHVVSALCGEAARNQDLLAIYRGNAVANANKALGLAYPVVEQIVGAEFFGGLSRAYWTEQPSRSGDLNEYGEGFAEFLSRFPHVADMPYLPDVARVEWLVSCALHAADHAPAEMAELSQVPPESLAALRFGLQPVLTILSSAWPVASIWQQHQPDFTGKIDIDLENAECMAIHRLGLRVAVSRLSEGEEALWRAALRGEALSVMLEAAFNADESFDVQAALQAGFAHEFVTSLHVAQD